MKYKSLPAAAFVLLAILTTASAWADGGCRTARTATFATPNTMVSATTGGAASPERVLFGHYVPPDLSK